MSQCATTAPSAVTAPSRNRPSRRSSPSSAVVRSTLRRSSSASVRSAVAPVSPVSAVRSSSRWVSCPSAHASAEGGDVVRLVDARRRVPAPGRAACRRGARCCSRGPPLPRRGRSGRGTRRRRLGSRRSTRTASSTDRRTASADGVGHDSRWATATATPRAPNQASAPANTRRRTVVATALDTSDRPYCRRRDDEPDALGGDGGGGPRRARAGAAPLGGRRVPDLDLPDVHRRSRPGGSSGHGGARSRRRAPAPEPAGGRRHR